MYIVDVNCVVTSTYIYIYMYIYRLDVHSHLGDCVVPITSHVAGVVLTKLWRLALKVTTWAKMMKPTRGRPLDQAKVYEAQPCKRSPKTPTVMVLYGNNHH